MSADATARLTALVEGDRVLADREAGDKLAEQVGGELALRWRIAVVRALIEQSGSAPDPDAVREAYGELVDRYRNDANALAQIKPLGEEIKKRESDGELPSTMVVRSERRKTTKPGF